MYRYIVFFILSISVFYGKLGAKEDEKVLIAILARNKAHTLPEYLDCIKNLDYDKKSIVIYINTNNNQDNTKEILSAWVEKNANEYSEVIFDAHEMQNQLVSSMPHKWDIERCSVLGKIRNKSLKKTVQYSCDYYFVVDCDNFILPLTLKFLISKDKPIIAPMLHPILGHDVYSNFCCSSKGWQSPEKHPKFLPIRNRLIVGTFEVPVVHCTYLVKAKYIDKLDYLFHLDHQNSSTIKYIDKINYLQHINNSESSRSEFWEFLSFSDSAYQNQIPQYICNEQDFGLLIHWTEEEIRADELTLRDEVRLLEDMNFPLLWVDYCNSHEALMKNY